MNITDFLLARIAEDEQRAEAVESVTYHQRWLTQGSRTVALAHPDETFKARILAECEAKKAIVEIHQMTEIRREPDQGKALGYWWDAYCLHCTMGGEFTDITKEPREKPCDTLLTLAAIYADHPDYRETWRL